MKCVVTGSAGFIGSHLCEQLIEDGHTVIGIDDLSNGKLSNLDKIINHPEFHYVTYDIAKGIKNFSLGMNVDWFFHLAAKADIVPSIEDPARYHYVNVTGTMRALQWARKFKAKRFIYAASSSCYGIPDEYPTKETAECRPMYPYALTKYLGEQYVMHWSKVYGLPAVSLRLFNVYGPRSRTSGAYGAVFGVFLSQLANGEPLTIVGDGKQSRDFTYVTDVVNAFIAAAKSTISGEILNVGSGGSYSIAYLASLLGGDKRVSLPVRPGEPEKTFADINKIYQKLGWVSRVSFTEGASKMRELVPAYKDAPVWTKDTIEKATKAWFDYLGGKQ